MAINTDAPRRPNLEPLWTNYNLSGGMPRIALGAAPSPAGLSPSPMSPRTLPSPMYPRSNHGSMNSQDRALVTSLNQRSRHPSLASPVSLAPIEEQSPLVSRLEKVAILSPINIQDGLPSPTSPPRSVPSRDHFYQVPPEQLYSSGPAVASAARGPLPPQLRPQYPRLDPVDRRVSAPAVPQLATQRRNSAFDIRDQLRLWGHVYYGDAKTADAFVIARSLRRQPPKGTGAADSEDAKTTRPSSSLSSSSSNRRQTVRAIVRPRALERQQFLIQRNFDMDELRATIPDPPHPHPHPHPQYQYQHYHHHHQPSPLSTRSESVARVSRSPVPTPEGGAGAAASPARPQPPRRRSSSVKSGALLSAARSGGALDPESLMRDAKAVPIHYKYAQAHLPVLARLLASGHVRPGDVIYLPVPHPEAWQQTVRHVYTGQGEPTLAVRENILYLAGKV